MCEVCEELVKETKSRLAPISKETDELNKYLNEVDPYYPSSEAEKFLELLTKEQELEWVLKKIEELKNKGVENGKDKSI